MSDNEDDNYVTFGVALDPLDEENCPRKKPVTIEDQCAYDAQGRRRFHGAFTGGFSAGYFNTVGTRDGWRPQQFKSSRSSKAENVAQRAEDFMDEEDIGQFGIAPKGIRVTTDYEDHGQRGKKRERKNQESDGPIPGVPVLRELLKPIKETVGIMLLKKMGWRPGQGVGSRVTKKEKAKIKRRNERIRMEQIGKTIKGSSSEESDDDCGDITFAPDDYEPFRCKPKDNYFGIGYSGLEKRNILSGHIDLFEAPAFSMQDKNRKLSIHGQAFGVGAFEVDDEDIYEREDMSRYDFALGPERKPKSRWSEEGTSANRAGDCLEGFVRAKNKLNNNKSFPLPELPKDFVPVHKVRKSRFYPPIEIVPRTLENGKRKDLTAVDRARILEDTSNIRKPSLTQPNAVSSVAANIVTRTLNLHGKQQVEERQQLETQQTKAAGSWMDKLNARNFVKGGVVGTIDESAGSLMKLEEFKDSSAADIPRTSLDAGTSEESNPVKEGGVKPFLLDPDKQRRYEQYLVLTKKGEKHKFESVQPLSMTEWDREHERTEFEQAARLFEQSVDSAGGRFTHASGPASLADAAATKYSQENEMKEAVKMKMFGKLTRERLEWKPASIVCKRFNIPEPKVGCAQPELHKRSAKFSIFDSLDWSGSTKFLKASDAVKQEPYEAGSRTKEKSTEEIRSAEGKLDVEIVNDRETLGSISEKMRNFEVTYEKVFGKGVQEVPRTESMDIERSSENISNSVEGEIQSGETTVEQEDRTYKDKSDEKKDLFKAIFLSSSEESDSEHDESVDSEAMKSVLIGKLPSEMNVQRNTSPPRGIFAKVDLDTLIVDPKHSDQSDESAVSKKKEVHVMSEVQSQTTSEQNDGESNRSVSAVLEDMYGPALPARLIKTEDVTPIEGTSSPAFKPVFRSVVVSKVESKISGKWVERGKVKKSKKEKKHKHKEHKSSKHKRKSKKEKR